MARGRGDEEDDLWHGIPALQAANGAGDGPQEAARAGTVQTAASDAAAAPDLAALIGFLRAHLKGGTGGRAIAGALFGGVFAPAQALIRARRDLTIWLPVFLALGIGAWFALGFLGVGKLVTKRLTRPKPPAPPPPVFRRSPTWHGTRYR